MSSIWQYGSFVVGAQAWPTDGSAPVTIVGKTEKSKTVNGYTDSIYRVRRGPTTTELWGGVLANASTIIGGRQRCHVRVVGTGPGKPRKVVAWLAGAPNKPIVFDPIEVQDSDRFGYSLSVKTTDGRGLRGVSTLIRLRFTYEACDYPNGEVVLMVCGGKLVYGLRATEASNEVGSASYKLIFPADRGGKAGVVQQLDTVTENGKREKTTRSLLRWDGSALVASR